MGIIKCPIVTDPATRKKKSDYEQCKFLVDKWSARCRIPEHALDAYRANGVQAPKDVEGRVWIAELWGKYRDYIKKLKKIWRKGGGKVGNLHRLAESQMIRFRLFPYGKTQKSVRIDEKAYEKELPMTPWEKDWARTVGPMSIPAMHFERNQLDVPAASSCGESVLDDAVMDKWNEDENDLNDDDNDRTRAFDLSIPSPMRNFEELICNLSDQASLWDPDQEDLDEVLGLTEGCPPDCGTTSARTAGREGEEGPSDGLGNHLSCSGAAGSSSGLGNHPAAMASSQPQANSASTSNDVSNGPTYRASFVRSEARRREVEEEN